MPSLADTSNYVLLHIDDRLLINNNNLQLQVYDMYYACAEAYDESNIYKKV